MKQNTIWIHQPRLFKHLEQTFGELIKNVREPLSVLNQEILLFGPERQ
jgi:hypothetical protein